MDASGQGGPNKYSAHTTFGPVRRRSLGRKEKTDGEERRRESEEIFKRSPEGEDHISSEEENLPTRGTSYRVSICTALSSAGPSDLGNSVPEKVPSIHPESGQGASKETKFKPAAMTSLVKEISQRRSKLKRRERTDGADLKRVCRREGISTTWRSGTIRLGQKSSSTRRTWVQDVLLMG